MLYHWYELSHAAVKPARMAANTIRLALSNPFNPFAYTAFGRHTSAVCEVFERTTRRYEKPTFGISTTRSHGSDVAIREAVVWQRPFCRLIHFEKDGPAQSGRDDPKVLLVAPMSGHYATLLRGTVETLLPDHEVYITDWQDARDVPLAAGKFDLDDYISYVIDMVRLFRGDVHVFAVCQPSVPVLAAAAIMEAEADPHVPHSVILAGGPVDTRVSPTAVNHLAESKGTDWFRDNVISVVPWSNPGAGRTVYPGFLQLTGFMTMNLDRHVNAHRDLFRHLVEGDGDSAEKHRTFYDEYLAVMDLTAEFYLQTIDTVFVRHALPRGAMRYRGRPVDLSAISRIALMTIEGEKDDITGLGQCHAALKLAARLDDGKKLSYTCPGVGHYGVFNGSRFRNDIAPRIGQFMLLNDPRAEGIAQNHPRRAARPRAIAAYGTGHDAATIGWTPHGRPLDLRTGSGQARNQARCGREASGPAMRTGTAGSSVRLMPETLPFQLWMMAGHLMANGLFGPSRSIG